MGIMVACNGVMDGGELEVCAVIDCWKDRTDAGLSERGKHLNGFKDK